jgi:hypothetical protein
MSEEAGEHTHEMGDSTTSVGIDTIGGGGLWVASHPHSHTVLEAGTHAHQMEIPGRFTGVGEGTAETSYDESAAGGARHLPPYYKLAFIVKLEETAPSDPSAQAVSSGGTLQGRLEALEEEVVTLSSTLDEARPYQVPARLIVPWSGSPDRLPAGWAMCDGEGGAPDLRDRFVLGAVGDEDLGVVGGSPDHTHDVRAHQHSAAVPAHAHEIPAQSAETDPVGDHVHEMHQAGLGDGISDWPADHDGAAMDHTHTITPAGAHSHQVAIPGRSTLEAEGSSLTSLAASSLDPAGNIPPYYKLAFIVKLRTGSTAADGPPPSRPVTLQERIEALEETVSQLSSALYAALSFFVPAEAIAVWPDSPDTPPAGWVVCDGNNGTPDLRGMFVMGTVVGAGERGGAETHAHSMEAHDHYAYFPHTHQTVPVPLRTATSPADRTGHSHRMGGGQSVDGDHWGTSHVMVASAPHYHFGPHDVSAIHEHDLVLSENIAPVGSELNAETTEETSVVMPAEHLPPYFKAVFVLKLDEEGV